MGLDLKGVVFDNDNTIAKIYPDPKIYWRDVFLKVVEECGGKVPEGKEDEYMISYYTGKGFIERLESIGLKTSMDEFQKVKGIVDERERVAYIKAGKAGLFPDAVKIFKYLTSKGIKFAVATFTTKAVVMEAFHQKPGVPQPQGFFDWNDSLRLKLEKPNPRIANIVLEQLDLRPEETAMVGDRLTDIMMGNLAGMTTFLVKRVEEDSPELIETIEKEIEVARFDPESKIKVPDYQITRLTDMIPILEG
ncbi:MAG: HAD family hydrolase [Candidatus Euphemobacter frigidus]|nr:HAD family hydrolase [Candidatus Euphemobacter frigidus]MDP8275886.1 HAD family hydrolase [Candidatus Euphemobacter frigidus]